MNQSDFAALAGTTKKSQITYEKGVMPDAAYLAAISAYGADVRYIITGDRDAPPQEVLSADERYLLDRYRSSPAPLKDAALRVLLGGDPTSPRKSKKQVFKDEVSGQVVMGKIINKGSRGE